MVDNREDINKEIEEKSQANVESNIEDIKVDVVELVKNNKSTEEKEPDIAIEEVKEETDIEDSEENEHVEDIKESNEVEDVEDTNTIQDTEDSEYIGAVENTEETEDVEDVEEYTDAEIIDTKEDIDKSSENIIEVKEDDLVSIDIEESEEVIKPDYEEEEIEGTGGLLDLLKSPIGKLLVKQGSETVIMNKIKAEITKEIASKGSEFIVDNLLKFNTNIKGKKTKRRSRKRRKMLSKQAEQQVKAKEDLKKFLEQHLMEFL